MFFAALGLTPACGGAFTDNPGDGRRTPAPAERTIGRG